MPGRIAHHHSNRLRTLNRAETSFMKPVTALKRGLAKVRRDWQAGHYDRALAEVNRLLIEWPDNPHLLVMWADLIQLQEADDGPTLEEAKAAYRRAADLDSDSPAALIELGHF